MEVYPVKERPLRLVLLDLERRGVTGRINCMVSDGKVYVTYQARVKNGRLSAEKLVTSDGAKLEGKNARAYLLAFADSPKVYGYVELRVKSIEEKPLKVKVIREATLADVISSSLGEEAKKCEEYVDKVGWLTIKDIIYENSVKLKQPTLKAKIIVEGQPLDFYTTQASLEGVFEAIHRMNQHKGYVHSVMSVKTDFKSLIDFEVIIKGKYIVAAYFRSGDREELGVEAISSFLQSDEIKPENTLEVFIRRISDEVARREFEIVPEEAKKVEEEEKEEKAAEKEEASKPAPEAVEAPPKVNVKEEAIQVITSLASQHGVEIGSAEVNVLENEVQVNIVAAAKGLKFMVKRKLEKYADELLKELEKITDKKITITLKA